MITNNSIDLTTESKECSMYSEGLGCVGLTKVHKECGSYRCPYYKPSGCWDWVRVEDEDGVNLIPPEEYEFSIRSKIKAISRKKRYRRR